MESVFGVILQRLVKGHPEIIGAVFADWEGEAVDLYHREGDEAFDVQELGAHMAILVQVIKHAHQKVSLGTLRELTISTETALYLVHPVDEDYYIGLWSTSGAPLGWAKRRLEYARVAIQKEM